MKIYVITPINYEYNDSSYYPEGYEKPVAAFRSRAKACERLYDMAQSAKSEDRRNDDDEPLTNFYELVELDVPDCEVEVPAVVSNRGD